MANTNNRAYPKGLREIRYPSNDIIQRFVSRDYVGYLKLNNETGLFEFDPPLEGTGGASSGTTFIATKASHGFTAGQPIYHDGSEFQLADASNIDTLAVWVVVEVTSEDTFTAAQSGRFEIVGHGLVPGNFYFVNEVAGGLTATEPGTYSNPIIYVETSDIIHVLPYRPSSTTSGGGGGGSVDSVFGRTGNVVAQSGDYTKDQVGLSNVLNVEQIPTSEKAVANGVATLDGSGTVPLSQLPNGIQGGIDIIGFWDADTNTPDLSSLTLMTGQAYQVTTAGSTNLNGITSWGLYDLAIWDSTVSGNWFKLSSSGQVTSVNSKTGAVVLDTDDISEGTNEYYTEAKVSANTDVVANTAKVSADGSIDTHSDVDTTTITPTAGNSLVWNNVDAKWVPGYVDGTLPGGMQGDILFHDGTDWAVLEASTAGFVLSTNGAGQDPTWIELKSSIQTQIDLTSTVTSDPGSGKTRLNNADQSLVTELYINENEYGSGNIGNFINALSEGSIIGFKAVNNRDKWVNYKVTSKTDNIGWWTVVLIIESKGTDFANDDIVGVSLLGVGDITRERFTLVDLSNVIDLNYNSKRELFSINNLNLSIAKTITRSNDSNAEKGLYIFNTTASSVTITFPSDTYYLDSDARWNKTTKVLTLVDAGSYLIKENKIDGKYYLEVSQVYDSASVILNDLFSLAGRGLTSAKKIYTSDDGQSWAGDDTNDLFKDNATCVRYGGNLFFGGGINGTFAWSENGTNWVECLNSGVLFTADVNDMIYSPTGAFWLAGGAQGSHSNNILRSTDGKTWTGVNNSLNILASGFVNVNGTIYCCGQGASATILKTINGTTYDDSLLKTIFGTACNGGDYANGLLVLGGEGGTIISWSDDDGATFNNLTFGGGSPFSTQCTDVKWVPFLNKWIATGQGNAEIALSDDANTWVPQTSGAVFPVRANSIIVGDGIIVLTGVAVGGGDNTVAYSTDGINWTGLGQTVFFNSGQKGVFAQIDSAIEISPIYRYLGDSITIRRRWTSPLSKLKQVYHFNYGVEGYTSNDVLSLVQGGAVPAKTDNDALIFLAVGVNDVRSNVSLATYQSNINSIIAELVTLGYDKTNIIIPTTYLITDFGSGSQGLMDSYNTWISGTLWAGGGTPYTYQADVYTEMVNNGGGTLLEDGIHPTVAGGLVIANYYNSII